MRKINDRSLTQAQRQKILERDDYSCLYCFGKADHVDHIIPWSFAHDNSDENLVSACWLCNLLAHDKVFSTFSLKRDYIINRRYWFQKRKLIPLWTQEELSDLGYTLRTHVESHAVICRDDAELNHCRAILLADGWRVVTKYTGKPTIGCVLGNTLDQEREAQEDRKIDAWLSKKSQ